MIFKLLGKTKKSSLENFQETIRKRFIDGDDIDLRTREFASLKQSDFFAQMGEVSHSMLLS